MKLTEQQIEDIIARSLHELESLGPEFKLEDDLSINLNLFDATNTLGQCGLGMRAPGVFSQEISFNKHIMFDCLEDLIVNNVYHEVCHYYQNKEAIRAGFYYFDEDGKPCQKDDPDLVDYFIGSDAGHSECWFKYVNIVNSRLNPTIPVNAHPEEIDMNNYFDANQDEVLFTIYCTQCDNKIKFLSYSQKDWESLPLGFLTTIIKQQKEGEENNFCKCGGCLKIDAKDEKILYNILEEENNRFMFEFLGGLFHGRKN